MTYVQGCDAAALLRHVAGRTSREWHQHVMELPCPPPPLALRRLNQHVRVLGKAAVRRHLTANQYKVPDIQGSHAWRCQLARYKHCQRFKHPGINTYLAQLFHCIQRGYSQAGLPQVHLSRFDLFHGHIFACHQHRALGILFHAKEYPAFDEEAFPHVLGYCQQGSDLTYCAHSMDWRNVLWYQGRLVALDLSVASPLHSTLLLPGTEELRTVYEDCFGTPLVDVNYLQLPGRGLRDRLFVA